MPLILLHTDKVKQALKTPMKLGVEAALFLAVGSAVGLIVMTAKQWSAPQQEKVFIDLSGWALPKYTLLSLGRGFAAYVVSLLFTFIYGTIAAHNRRAEKVMIPALDVLQAIPVLGFLPGFVLAMVALFPNREIGLELACILMIFTGQAWNMTFSFHASLRNVPSALREVAQLQRFSSWQTFRIVEVPAAMIGLVWNSMMSMAGGWFFLTVNEAFTLGEGHDYRLPGIGSYMAEAINQGDSHAMVMAIVAMVLMIVAVDQIFWRPIVVWSQRFKLEDQADVDAPQSWVLEIFRRSVVVRWVGRFFARRTASSATKDAALVVNARKTRTPGAVSKAARLVMRWAILGLLLTAIIWGAVQLVRLLLALPLSGDPDHHDWAHVVAALGLSFLRTTAAVALGAAWTLPVGILIGLSPRWSQRLQPIVQVLASFPAPMLFPLVVMLLAALHVPFGIGCIALMLLGAQWYVLFNVVAGASAIPADLKEAATVYHLPAIQRWKRLYIPCVFPYLVTGLVTAAGGAWNATIVAEYLQIKGQTLVAFGLGSIISQATAAREFPMLAAAVITMSLFVVILNRLLWKRMYRLAESRYSLTV